MSQPISVLVGTTNFITLINQRLDQLWYPIIVCQKKTIKVIINQ